MTLMLMLFNGSKSKNKPLFETNIAPFSL